MESVTAVVPFHNDSRTIERALESVASQTHPPVEIRVVDDASRPEEAAFLDGVLERWPSERPPLRMRRLAVNAGPAAARNEGWGDATGDWIAFCDADDVWHPERIRSQLSSAGDAALVSCLRAATPDAMLPPRDVTRARVAVVGRAQLIVWNPIMTSAVLVRRDVEPRFTTGRRYTEDYELWLRIVLAGGQARLVQHPLIAPQIPDAEASGLTTHRWAMTRGEWATYGLVHRDGLMNRPEYAWALAVSALRAVRRHALVGLGRLRHRASR